MTGTRTTRRLMALVAVWAATATILARAEGGRLETKHIAADGSVTVESEVSAPASSSSAPQRKLVPFPEDEAPREVIHASAVEPLKPVAKPVVKQVAQQEPRKSNFQPKFRPPAIRRVQHTEPVLTEVTPKAAESAPAAADQVAESNHDADPGDVAAPAQLPDAATGAAVLPSEPEKPAELQPIPAQADMLDSPGRDAVDQAFDKSKQAKSEAEYSEVIELCRQGIKEGLKRGYEDYAGKLMAWAYNRRGEARAEAGREQEALADFEAAVELGGSWRAVHNRGVSYASLGQAEPAMADFNKTIELNDKYPNAYFNRAELRFAQGNFAGAVDDYSKAVQLGTRDAATFTGRGNALHRLERYGEALRDFGEALRQEPNNAAVMLARGDIYSHLGKYGEAAKDYREACRVAPNLGRAYQSASWLMATCPDAHYRNEKLAVEAAHKSIELEGADYRNLSTLAAAQASAGLFAEAQATQQKALAAAGEQDRPAAQKLMAMYQQQVAYRDSSQRAFTPPEEQEVKQASALLPFGGEGKSPNRQAMATSPAPGPSAQQAQPPAREMFPPQLIRTNPAATLPRQVPPPQQQQRHPPRKRLFGG